MPTYLGFPPRRHYVVVPSRPARAARTGLALYDASRPYQRVAENVARAAFRLGLGAAFRLPADAPLPDLEWWDEWIAQVAGPHVGPVAGTAFRLLGEFAEFGTTALLLDRDGAPLAFVKVRRGERFSDLAVAVTRILGDVRHETFSSPRLMAEGVHDGWRFFLQEPLPEGAHRPLPDAPVRLGPVVDEFQSILGGLIPAGAPPGSVMVHGSLAPRNLRRAADGRVWMFDFDQARPGPRLADELRYWISALGADRRPVSRKAAGIVELLSKRGSTDELVAAMEWRIAARVKERGPGVEELRKAIADEIGFAYPAIG